MDALYAAFFADPLYYIGCLFALFGAWGFMMFLVGFASGARHLFTYGESDTHMKHARERIVWGLLLVMVVFGLWEIVRVIAGVVPVSYLWISFFMLTPLWIPWLWTLMKGGKKNGGH